MNFGIHREWIYVIRRILLSIFSFRFRRNDNHAKTVNTIYGQILDIVKFLYDLYQKPMLKTQNIQN